MNFWTYSNLDSNGNQVAHLLAPQPSQPIPLKMVGVMTSPFRKTVTGQRQPGQKRCWLEVSKGGVPEARIWIVRGLQAPAWCPIIWRQRNYCNWCAQAPNYWDLPLCCSSAVSKLCFYRSSGRAQRYWRCYMYPSSKVIGCNCLMFLLCYWNTWKIETLCGRPRTNFLGEVVFSLRIALILQILYNKQRPKSL